MVTVSLFITEEQPRCLSFSRTDRKDKWINNSHADSGILFSILLSEKSQPKNTIITYCMIPTTVDLWAPQVWIVWDHLYTDY